MLWEAVTIQSKFNLGILSFRGILGSLEIYDFETQTWTLIKTERLLLKGHVALAMPDGIYVIGGFNGKEYQNTLSKYAPVFRKTTIYRFDL